MRESYHESLESVIDDLVGMNHQVQTAVALATRALLDADLAVAEQVISGDAQLDAKHDELETRCFTLLARQAPVAGELRMIVAALRMVADLARMGDLAAHIAKVARLRYPDKAVPEGLVPNFSLMARVAEEMVGTAGRSLLERNAHDAGKLAVAGGILRKQGKLSAEEFEAMKTSEARLVDELRADGIPLVGDIDLGRRARVRAS